MDSSGGCRGGWWGWGGCGRKRLAAGGEWRAQEGCVWAKFKMHFIGNYMNYLILKEALESTFSMPEMKYEIKQIVITSK